MTPLHWAAYNNDEVVALILMRAMHKDKQYQRCSAAGAMPIDIAGFMKNKKVINAIVDQHELWMEEEAFTMKYPEDQSLETGRKKFDRQELERKLIDDDQSNNNQLDEGSNKPINTGKSDGVNEIGQRICKLEKAHTKELDNEYDLALVRVFYWAAFIGRSDTVIDYMILYKRWSPYLKAFKK
jgi:hypothetical protein